jgi:WD40 repeat protein
MSKTEEGIKILEKIDLSDDEDEEDFQYEEIRDDDDLDAEDDNELADALASLQLKNKVVGNESLVNQSNAMTQVRPSVVDDFLRNFLIKAGLKRSLDTFNTEWYEMQSKGKLPAELSTAVPDIYLRNEELDKQAGVLREQVEKMRAVASKAESTWDKFRKERDFHRMHHKRVVQEKNKLIDDLRRLRNHLRSYEPTIEELKKRHESAMKEKMMIKLERDRLKSRVKVLDEQVANLSQNPSMATGSKAPGAPGEGSQVGNGVSGKDGKKRQPTRAVRKQAAFPPDDPSSNPYLDMEFDPANAENYMTRKSFKGHLNSVSAVAFHPKKPVFATASDDETWRLWNVPDCELIMSGEGHGSWLSDLHFHPHGSHLVTGSGDATVKIWEFSKARCTHTFTEHTQAVWGTEFHFGGDLVASCSMDHTARIWDLISGKCRQTLRGHVDSVNACAWVPFTSNLCTAAGDKTVSVWDGRTGLCVQTLYGHSNSCNHVKVSKQGDVVISADADGVVKVWDIRMIAELGTIECGQYPINKLDVDRSGSKVVAASDDGTLKVISLKDLEVKHSLAGHEGPVQSCSFSPNDAYFVSGASDSTFRLWAE